MESSIEAKAKGIKIDAVFSMIEDFIREESHIKNGNGKRGREREFIPKDTENSKLVSVFTPEWRKAVIHFAKNLPIDLLIREFTHFYYNKTIPTGTTKSVAKECHQNDLEAKDLPDEILVNIFLKLPLHDLLSSRSVCCDWASVYASKHFQALCTSTEKCIVINNHNLDMWVFSIVSKRWFLLKVPCDWDSLGMRTLGIKASSNGLFLVARSDLSLYVVNPLTTEFKSLPQIPQTWGGINFLKSLIVHGTAEMEVKSSTGRYIICFFFSCPGQGNADVSVARYISWTGVWRLHQISLSFSSNLPFPSPLWSYIDFRCITCFSATFTYFVYSIDSFPKNRTRSHGVPITMGPYFELDGVTCALPRYYGEVILVGRMKQNDNGSQTYGRLPIVCHRDIGLLKLNRYNRRRSIIDIITAESIENMIKSSEGTDFLAVGDGGDNIWLMLRGSKDMIHYNLGTKEWIMEAGCPGGGYMDANLPWKAAFNILKFDAQVSG